MRYVSTRQYFTSLLRLLLFADLEEGVEYRRLRVPRPSLFVENTDVVLVLCILDFLAEPSLGFMSLMNVYLRLTFLGVTNLVFLPHRVVEFSEVSSYTSWRGLIVNNGISTTYEWASAHV